ncbi:signal peptidase I [Thiospirochaeta perfilievii]|uniref:Signal peptidase I n=1 Tax=Thiospirochaeta perfilievii TaxID=252967 RepID=A0A5C1QGA3_9SPIO|nr:signal peptidase I [Thiospirochaeta perfilievii]QEN06099.1 signal peptidase I [Thiospirochaeta perfilievii]
MGRSSNKRYRSYSEKKSQTKKFRVYFIRIAILILFYSIFTAFVAISIRVDGNSMEPTIDLGSSLILQPSQNINKLLKRKNIKNLRRGEVVLTSTNYVNEPKLIEEFLDPIVRIFTLQKRSVVYDNRGYKGRSELLRVVGLPGDTVKIKDGTVYIKPSGQDFFLSEFELTKLDYDIIKNEDSDTWKKEFPFSSEYRETFVTEGHYFLISDNRRVFNDSRVFGLSSKENILGRVVLKYWPIDEFKIY